MHDKKETAGITKNESDVRAVLQLPTFSSVKKIKINKDGGAGQGSIEVEFTTENVSAKDIYNVTEDFYFK